MEGEAFSVDWSSQTILSYAVCPSLSKLHIPDLSIRDPLAHFLVKSPSMRMTWSARQNLDEECRASLEVEEGEASDRGAEWSKRALPRGLCGLFYWDSSSLSLSLGGQAVACIPIIEDRYAIQPQDARRRLFLSEKSHGGRRWVRDLFVSLYR